MNPWLRLKSLLAESPKVVGIIQSHSADGNSTAQLSGGGIIKVNGQDYPIGQRVFIRDHDTVGSAPNLPAFTIDV